MAVCPGFGAWAGAWSAGLKLLAWPPGLGPMLGAVGPDLGLESEVRVRGYSPGLWAWGLHGQGPWLGPKV